ncbi:MAG: hypothetical protein K2N28_02380 [Muribaculaceae bacterium]|nr:hypothetical protein [Muribaculaceae bacterium]
MNLSQILKAIVIGFLFGFCLVWLLAIILPFILSVNPIDFVHQCSEDIYSFSLYAGLIGALGWLILADRGLKKKKKEELENEMLEYFRKQNESVEKD